MAVLSPPFLLGAGGQVLSGRLARLSLNAVFRPATSGVQVVSGVLAGPANTMGELALPSATQLTVQPFRAVIQSALDATAGSYLVPNDAQVTLAVTAQHATQFRRSLVVVRVDDSQVSGVASTATTDRSVLEILDGPLAASAVAATLPAPAGSWLALGEVLIPPTGQTVTLTPYNPRTGMRHGILPVIVDSSTVTGHDGAPGAFVGQYRDHPTQGLQRWDGANWRNLGLGVDAPMLKARLTAAGVTVASNAFTLLVYTAPADFDTANQLVPATGLVTVARTGYHWLWAGVDWATAFQQRTAIQFMRGAAVGGAPLNVGRLITPVSAADNGVECSGIAFLTAGDVIHVEVYQASGANQTVGNSSFGSTGMSMAWLRP